jgi:hypothetical protein
MLDRIVDWIMHMATAIPALLVAEDSPSFTLIRTMFALILIAFFAYLIAMRPFRLAISRCAQILRNLFAPKPR